MAKIDIANLFEGFSKLDFFSRLKRLQEAGVLSSEDFEFLFSGGLQDSKLGEKFIENMVGYFQVPMGVATNFEIDGVSRFIPMAVEETSIIAAASKTAKWVRENGEIKTEMLGVNIIGQIQIAKVKNWEKLEQAIEAHKDTWIKAANTEVAASMIARGGGVDKIHLRKIKRPDGGLMAVIHVEMNAVDAMGANVINQVCEYLKKPIELATGETVTMCILSNLTDTRLTKATVTLNNVSAELMEKIEEASLFAQLDPYRAATNNKGVLNGIDPILIATGNDWRAVEAGVHAYAAQSGHYTSVTKWKRVNSQLVGEFCAPLIVGTVGGVTALHPMAKLSLKILKVNSAAELSRVAAAVGLVQNLGALKALTTVGIIEGHMKLHIKNLSLGAGATDNELSELSIRLEKILTEQKRITLSHAVEALKELRSNPLPT